MEGNNTLARENVEAAAAAATKSGEGFIVALQQEKQKRAGCGVFFCNYKWQIKRKGV